MTRILALDPASTTGWALYDTDNPISAIQCGSIQLDGKGAFEKLSALLRYEPETGRLFWKPRPVEMFASEKSAKTWNTRFSDQEALTAVDSGGYKHGQICGRNYRAHRVIWFLSWGEWPTHEVDHINGDRSDNRLDNLRAVSHSQNMRNARRPSDNTSGVTGVCWDKSRGKWLAQIQAEGARKRLGLFDEFDTAVARRRAAEAESDFHPNHGRAA